MIVIEMILYLGLSMAGAGFLEGWIDSKADNPEHRLSFWARIVIIMLITWLLCGVYIGFSGMALHINVIAMFSYCWVMYNSFVDMGHNFGDGQKIFYVGKTAKHDKRVREFLNDNIVAYFFGKMLAKIVTGVALYFTLTYNW